MDFTEINYTLGQTFGVTLFDPQQFTSLVIRFVINLIVVILIARKFYYPRSMRRDYMFIFILMAMSIFLLVSLMDGGGMQLGAAMGLFAIFGIMRFRTEAVPIREMTYLFMLIALSVINALAHGDYHPKADLEKRTGLKIERIEVGMIDYLKDAVLIRIFYNEEVDRGSSIAEVNRMPR